MAVLKVAIMYESRYNKYIHLIQIGGRVARFCSHSSASSAVSSPRTSKPLKPPSVPFIPNVVKKGDFLQITQFFHSFRVADDEPVFQLSG
ncbi:hypothetical protein CEXT_694461 [Caerostris extrusa]|uniref:Uncharacterized protein n=1 Tax=Caerostris extrusa TaxID=172846 RepID=A0AAV4T591_CAEEX|nr:hypothetical protein CEXT_694461 [Caerostris extrusa]